MVEVVVDILSDYTSDTDVSDISDLEMVLRKKLSADTIEEHTLVASLTSTLLSIIFGECCNGCLTGDVCPIRTTLDGDEKRIKCFREFCESTYKEMLDYLDFYLVAFRDDGKSDKVAKLIRMSIDQLGEEESFASQVVNSMIMARMFLSLYTTDVDRARKLTEIEKKMTGFLEEMYVDILSSKKDNRAKKFIESEMGNLVKAIGAIFGKGKKNA